MIAPIILIFSIYLAASNYNYNNQVSKDICITKGPGHFFFLHNHGATRFGLNSGPVLGYGSSPRTTDRHKKTIREKCNTFFKKNK